VKSGRDQVQMPAGALRTGGSALLGFSRAADGRPSAIVHGKQAPRLDHGDHRRRLPTLACARRRALPAPVLDDRRRTSYRLPSRDRLRNFERLLAAATRVAFAMADLIESNCGRTCSSLSTPWTKRKVARTRSQLPSAPRWIRLHHAPHRDAQMERPPRSTFLYFREVLSRSSLSRSSARPRVSPACHAV